MATVVPRSPLLNQALHNPIHYLPVTRFPNPDERIGIDQIHEIAVETQKEREVIQSQPYRTTQLVFPGVKPNPALVNNKLSGARPTVYRPLDERSVVMKLDENRALITQQFNSPGALYSQPNVREAIYEQTGVHLQTPLVLPEFNPANSPTFQALIEEETPAKIMPAPHVQRIPPPQKYAGVSHATAPTSNLNSVGQPSERIAQSGSFRRLMLSVGLVD